jgi:hypothetical protein
LRRHLATRCLRAWCALLSITYDIRWPVYDENTMSAHLRWPGPMDWRSWIREAAIPAANATAIAEGTILVSLVAAKTPVNMPWLTLGGVLILLGTLDGKKGSDSNP